MFTLPRQKNKKFFSEAVEKLDTLHGNSTWQEAKDANTTYKYGEIYSCKLQAQVDYFDLDETQKKMIDTISKQADSLSEEKTIQFLDWLFEVV